jgi:hypothetical protein
MIRRDTPLAALSCRRSPLFPSPFLVNEGRAAPCQSWGPTQLAMVAAKTTSLHRVGGKDNASGHNGSVYDEE